MASSDLPHVYGNSALTNPQDDPVNILSIEASRLIEKFTIAFLPCVVVIGLITNTVNGLVFWLQGLRDRMNLCLFCLTLADFAYLITVLVIVIINPLIKQIDSRVTAEYTVKATTYGIGFMFGFRALSRLISMVIAVERCVCVVFPLRAASLIQSRTMGFVLVTIFVFVQLLYATMATGLEVTSIQDNQTGNVFWLASLSPFYRNKYLLYQIIYHVVPRVVIPVGTFLTIAVARCITVVRLRAAMSWRQQTSSSISDNQGQQMALTKMLVVVSCVYITCSTPSVIQAMLEICRSDFLTGGPFYNLVRKTGSLTNVFLCINSSVNFFVYFSRSTRFRHELQTLCCCRIRLNKAKVASWKLREGRPASVLPEV